MLVIVCYDITDDRRRNALHKRLKRFGEPVQYSVFECPCTRGELVAMKREVAEIITREDDVRYYRLCAACESRLAPGQRKRRKEPSFVITGEPGDGTALEGRAATTSAIEVEPFGLMAQACSYRNLQEAWKRVKSNRGCAGIDRITVRRFSLRLSRNLSRLRTELLNGTYTPQPLKLVLIPKKSGGMRSLGIPTIRDRVAQQAVYRVIAPVWEPHLSEASFAYRPGRSVGKAVRVVEKWRSRGYIWVVDADINSYFDNVDHGMLMEMVSSRIDDKKIIELISAWLKVQAFDGKRYTERLRGVPQGGVISPLLSNIYLDYLDRKLLDEHYRLVRYADDFIILCNDRLAARQAVRRAESILGELRLELNEKKTRITSFKEGFEFLGIFFKGGLRLPGRAKRAKSAFRWRI